MLFGQLARLHDEARQLATRDSTRVPCPWSFPVWVSSKGPRCFTEKTTAGVKARQRGTAQPIPCSPALVGARANALGISCLDVLRFPLMRDQPLRPYDHGGWPRFERCFIAHPNTKGYFSTRIRRDSAGSKRTAKSRASHAKPVQRDPSRLSTAKRAVCTAALRTARDQPTRSLFCRRQHAEGAHRRRKLSRPI